MKFIKLSAVLLCICILLTACAGNGENNTEEAESVTSAENTSNEITSKENNSTVPTASSEKSDNSSNTVSAIPENKTLTYNRKKVTVTNEYGNVLKNIGNVGTTVTAYGKLKEDKYKSSLEKLEKVFDNYSHTVSAVAYSLDNSSAVCYNTSTDLFCACTVKAAYTLYCCKQMESGKCTLDTKMKYEKKHYEPGTGDMQYCPIGTEFDMRTILDKTMRISDNVGYMMATDYFGREGYNKWITDLGCPSLKISPTVWSLHAKAKDLAVIWKEIYDYFGKNTEYSNFLYNSCTNTPNNYATAALNLEYSHKQGNNRSGKWLAYSDAGIVWKDGNPYIIVILTNAPGPSDYDAKMMKDAIKIINNELF
ncbi:MAG: serine hydrolase [Clostridiales bacterium]|nr:serine hydrolase [Candidatus Equinaster intestinalis]